MKDAELTAELASRRTRRLTAERAAWARRNPIASDLADCGARYQVMALLGWGLRPPPDERGAALMEQGNEAERIMIRQLQDEGWEVVQQQAPFEVWQPLPDGRRARVLSGRLDGKLRLPDGGELVPFDTKDTSQWNVEGLETEDDLRTRSRWTRKWWRQMQAYMLGEGHERALLILGHRGARRFLAVRLDYEEAERVLRWAAYAVAAAERWAQAGLGLEQLDAWLLEAEAPYASDPNECATCPFKDRLCHPPDPAKEARNALRPELEADVARFLELGPAVREHDALRQRLKEETEGSPVVVAGRFLGAGRVRTRKMKAQPAKPETVQEYWEIKWQAPGVSAEEDA